MTEAPAPYDPTADGWKQSRREGAFTNLLGPFWSRREGEAWAYGAQAEQRHLNANGAIHGGLMLSFADETLGMTVWEAVGRRRCVTMQLALQFIGAVSAGDFLEMRGEVLRVTRSVVFVRGRLTVGERTVAHADGVWKILEPRQ